MGLKGLAKFWYGYEARRLGAAATPGGTPAAPNKEATESPRKMARAWGSVGLPQQPFVHTLRE